MCWQRRVDLSGLALSRSRSRSAACRYVPVAMEQPAGEEMVLGMQEAVERLLAARRCAGGGVPGGHLSPDAPVLLAHFHGLSVQSAGRRPGLARAAGFSESAASAQQRSAVQERGSSSGAGVGHEMVLGMQEAVERLLAARRSGAALGLVRSLGFARARRDLGYIQGLGSHLGFMRVVAQGRLCVAALGV